MFLSLSLFPTPLVCFAFPLLSSLPMCGFDVLGMACGFLPSVCNADLLPDAHLQGVSSPFTFPQLLHASVG